MVAAFWERKRLAALGFQGNVEELEGWEVEAFTFISSEYDRLENEERKKRQRSKGR